MTSIQDATVLAQKVCLSGRVGRAAVWVSDLALWLLDKRLLLSNPALDAFVHLNAGQLRTSEALTVAV